MLCKVRERFYIQAVGSLLPEWGVPLAGRYLWPIASVEFNLVAYLRSCNGELLVLWTAPVAQSQLQSICKE